MADDNEIAPGAPNPSLADPSTLMEATRTLFTPVVGDLNTIVTEPSGYTTTLRYTDGIATTRDQYGTPMPTNVDAVLACKAAAKDAGKTFPGM